MSDEQNLCSTKLGYGSQGLEDLRPFTNAKPAKIAQLTFTPQRPVSAVDIEFSNLNQQDFARIHVLAMQKFHESNLRALQGSKPQ